MFQTRFLFHPADLLDMGIDDCLDHVQAVGATGITVWATSGAVSRVRSNPDANPRVYRTRGGFFFPPNADLYQDSRLKPVTSTWLRGRDPLAQVAAACEKRDLELRLRISAFEVGRIAQKHPEAASKTVFGDPSPVTLCPANPDVRALLRGTVNDLVTRFPSSIIEITDLEYYSGLMSDDGIELAFNPGEGALGLLGICFCESSRQEAMEKGVDSAAVASAVEAKLNKILTSGKPDEYCMDELVDGSDLGAYMQCQVSTLNALFYDLAEKSPSRLALVLPWEVCEQIPPFFTPCPKLAGVVIQDLHTIDDPFEDVVSHVREALGEDVKTSLELEVAQEAAEHPQQLVATVKKVADQGFSGVDLSSYAVVPPDCFDPIKQAIRYGRRAVS